MRWCRYFVCLHRNMVMRDTQTQPPTEERQSAQLFSMAGIRCTHALAGRGIVFHSAQRNLLDIEEMQFDAEGITCIMGYNGAGKSLLLRILHGMIQPTLGSVTWNNKPVDKYIRLKQAMVFQKPVLLRRSVQANIEFVLASRGIRVKERSMALLAQVGLTHLAASPARLLSGGEQQRLALARALACDPEILFLDEATASLDPASIATIERIVCKSCTSGTKVVLVTHDTGQARRLANEVIFIHQGQISEQSDAATFFSNPGSEQAQAYLDGRIYT